MAIARDLNKESFSVVPVVGDGAIVGGESLEALNHLGSINNKVILILNDNKENAVFPNSNTSFLLSGIYFPPPIKYSFSHSSAFTFIKL